MATFILSHWEEHDNKNIYAIADTPPTARRSWFVTGLVRLSLWVQPWPISVDFLCLENRQHPYSMIMRAQEPPVGEETRSQNYNVPNDIHRSGTVLKTETSSRGMYQSQTRHLQQATYMVSQRDTETVEAAESRRRAVAEVAQQRRLIFTKNTRGVFDKAAFEHDETMSMITKATRL
ncbi:hypothetical protein TNCV_2725621 [Trichonephila clavipes]|nr:hypothetical protein TNCV_2725621 [Trichonephila clavipes]